MPLLPFPSSVRRQAPAQVLHCSASLFRIFMTSRLGGNCFGIRLGGLFGGLCGRLVPSQLYRSRPVPQDICMIAPSHNSPPHLASQTYFPHLLHWRAPRQTLARRLASPLPSRRLLPAAPTTTRRRGFRLHYPWHQELALRARSRTHPSGDSLGAPFGCTSNMWASSFAPFGGLAGTPASGSHPHFGVLVSLIHAPRRLRGPPSAFGRLRTSSTSAISSDCESSGLSPLLLMIRQSLLCVSSPLTPLTPT